LCPDNDCIRLNFNVVVERSFSLKPSAEKLAAQVRKKGRDSGGQ
jgi:hypothetical protein